MPSSLLIEIIVGLMGVVFGALITYVVLQSRSAKNEKNVGREIQDARVRIATLEAELRQSEQLSDQQKKVFYESEKRLSDAFSQLAQTALTKSSEQFLKLAEQNFEKHTQSASHDLSRRQQSIENLVKPLEETLTKLELQAQEIEQKRLSAYDSVTDHINRLMVETTQLSNALRKPHVRGSWGELTLLKAAESAGLVEGQDFYLQFSSDTDEGRLRPDMVVHLPNEGIIVVDSKVPLDSYLDAMSTNDEAVKQLRLKSHAGQVRKHIQALSSKAYWSQFDRSPDFVVMFVPAESLYQAALEQDAELLEAAFRARIVLANPMTLIALLRTVGFAMNQQKVQTNALEIKKVGEKLYESIRIFSTHMSNVGRHLGQTSEAYNKALGSMERNVLSKARQLKQMGAGVGSDMEVLEPISIGIRENQ